MANFVYLDKGYLIEGSAAAVAYRFVSMGTTDQGVDITPTLGQLVLGVCMENIDATKVTTGKAVADIRLMGIAPVTVGTTPVTLGVEVSTQTDGRAIPALSTHRVAGIALQAGATGEIINVLLTPAGRIV